MKIWLNGAICEGREAVVSVYDHGFLYGLGLFETFRTYGGRPFLLEEHLQRLAAGCLELGIDFRPDLAEIEAVVRSLLEANGLEDGYFRLSVSGGAGALGLPAGDYMEPTVILYVKELPPGGPQTGMDGKPLQLLRLRRSTPEGTVRRKSFHYMNNILAKREMASYPWASGAEGLFLTGEGHLAEGIVSNLFFVKDSLLVTPSLETGILPGITRAFTVRLAGDLGLEVREGFHSPDELARAEEAFLTNSIQGIVPAGRLYDPEGRSRVIGAGGGPVTARLSDAYRQAAGGGR